MRRGYKRVERNNFLTSIWWYSHVMVFHWMPIHIIRHVWNLNKLFPETDNFYSTFPIITYSPFTSSGWTDVCKWFNLLLSLFNQQYNTIYNTIIYLHFLLKLGYKRSIYVFFFYVKMLSNFEIIYSLGRKCLVPKWTLRFSSSALGLLCCNFCRYTQTGVYTHTNV